MWNHRRKEPSPWNEEQEEEEKEQEEEEEEGGWGGVGEGKVNTISNYFWVHFPDQIKQNSFYLRRLNRQETPTTDYGNYEAGIIIAVMKANGDIISIITRLTETRTFHLRRLRANIVIRKLQP